MKKIDELASHIDETLLDGISLDEQPLNAKEVRRIHAMVIREIKGGKRMNRKVVISLIAAVIAITGVTAAAAGIGAAGRFGDFYKADTESKASTVNLATQEVKPEAKPAKTTDEFSIEVAGVIGDKNNASIILDLIANDGRVLDDTYRLENIQLEFDPPLGVGRGFSGGSGSFKDTNLLDNRISFIYTVNTGDTDLSLANVTIKVGGVGRVTDGNPHQAAKINIGELVAANKSEWTKNEDRMSKQGERKGFSFPDMHGKKSIEEFTDAEIDLYNTNPKMLILSQNLAINVSDKLKNTTLEAIGVKGDRLQMLFHISKPDESIMPALLNIKTGKVIKYNGGIGSSDDGIFTKSYIEFIIPNGTDLSDFAFSFDQEFPFKSVISDKVNTLKLALDYTDTMQVIKLDAPAKIGKVNLVVNLLEVSPFSISVVATSKDTSDYDLLYAYDFNKLITLRMKDGSVIKEFNGGGIQSGSDGMSTVNIDRQFNAIIELKNVAAVIVGETEFPVELK